MKTRRVSFDNGRGEQLAARLDLPLRDRPRAYAVFAHCFTCSKNLTAAVHVSRTLVTHGWAVLRFDFTGLGDSEGEFADTHFSSNIEDLIGACEWLAEHHAPPALLVGHSLGGAAVLRAAASVDSVAAIATLGAPARPDHILALLEDHIGTIEREGEAAVNLAGRRFTIKRSFLEDLRAHEMQAAVGELHRALLVLHAPADAVVGVENAAEIFAAAKHPKSFVSLEGADHLLTRPTDARFAADVIAAWAQRFLPMSDDSSSISDDVTAWGPQRAFTTELTVGEHSVISDEPREVGGEDRGPSPYGLLLGSLGACTVMTLRMYADRKGWPLEQAVCHLRHAKVHAADCETCAEQDDPKAKVDRIDRRIELRGELDAAQRERLLEIADRCPVHRTLSAGNIKIVTEPV
ncbi:MAG: alpha/beta fold hydrolase [Nannocystaceae bacterium]|nr:alpha/beta fold hydrolase [Nannocystaceae bacterium]